MEVPLGLDHPYWVDDPNFDLDFHIRHIAVPPPGDEHQLAELAARIAARHLDRSRDRLPDPARIAHFVQPVADPRHPLIQSLDVDRDRLDGVRGRLLSAGERVREPPPCRDLG